MRKVRSAPQLAGMEAKNSVASAAAVGSPRHLPAGTAAGMHGLQKKTGPAKGSAMRTCLRRSSSPRHGLKALMIDAPTAPPPSDGIQIILSEAIEQADELVEEFVWARGLIPAGECFEQFGWTEAAPPLKDVRQPVNDEQRRALASCLATPFMYDDEHLSKHLQSQVSKTSQENNRNLTNRYVEEVRENQVEDAEKDTSSYAGQQAAAKTRRRRRSNKAIYVDQIQASAPPLAGRTPSPDTHRFLSRALSSLEDDRNKLHFDESALAEMKNLASVSIDPACMNLDLPDAALFSMDEPFRFTDDPKPTPGGVMEVCMDDNMLTAEQQKEPQSINDGDSLGQKVVNESGSAKVHKATNDTSGLGDVGIEGVTDDAMRKSAAKEASDSDNMLQDASAPDAQPQNNVLPFKRHGAPRL